MNRRGGGQVEGKMQGLKLEMGWGQDGDHKKRSPLLGGDCS